MNTALSHQELQAHADVHSYVVDYSYLEDNSDVRKKASAAFQQGKVYAPDFDYPKIKNPDLGIVYDYQLPAGTPQEKDEAGNKIFDRPLSEKKTITYNAVFELEANKASGVWSEARCSFYADYHEAYLKKILLIESAGRLNDPELSSQQSLLAREEFMALNEAVFGEYDTAPFEGMMNTEQKRIEAFVPQNEAARKVKMELEQLLGGSSFEREEEPLIDQAELALIAEAVYARYADILSPVPQTGDHVIYDVYQSVEIVDNSLKAAGLYDKGWRAKEHPSKQAPSTNVEDKRIYLPLNTRRTADELRRLIVHEQEVHARRGQNGEESGEKPLKTGTAAYADVEEGLGVLLECAVAGTIDNPSFHRARDRYILAGLALGADGTPRDARQSYETMWRLLAVRMASDGVIDQGVMDKAKSQAMTHVENAFRGTNFAMPGVIYTKLKVYYEGLAKNVTYFRNFDGTIDEALDAAMVGKCDHTDENEMNNIKGMLAERAAA